MADLKITPVASSTIADASSAPAPAVPTPVVVVPDAPSAPSINMVKDPRVLDIPKIVASVRLGNIATPCPSAAQSTKAVTAADGPNLSRANFTAAHMSELQWPTARFSGALFRKTDISDVDFQNADFSNAVFGGTKMKDVDVRGANFAGADLRARDGVPGFTGTGVNFGTSNLAGARFDGTPIGDASFAGATGEAPVFAYASGYGATFCDAKLPKASFEGAILPAADFRKAQITSGNFVSATLVGADLRGAVLNEAHFDHADLRKANFCGARLDNATFDDVKIDGARFCGSNPITDAAFHSAAGNAIRFEYNSASVNPDAEPSLRVIAGLLRADPARRLVIEGHTDSIGSAQFNQGLSERRAAAVASFLLANGVQREQLATAGFGFTRPVAPNATDEGRALNRRVNMDAKDPKHPAD